MKCMYNQDMENTTTTTYPNCDCQKYHGWCSINGGCGRTTIATPAHMVADGDVITWTDNGFQYGGTVTGIIRAGSGGVSADGTARMVARIGFVVDGARGPAFDANDTVSVRR